MKRDYLCTYTLLQDQPRPGYILRWYIKSLAERIQIMIWNHLTKPLILIQKLIDLGFIGALIDSVVTVVLLDEMNQP